MAELVARLEGIPLALELAAARVRSLSVADINKRLNDRYKMLTGGSRVLQERQQTLRALVDWSYDLLNENEQLLLRRLAVFVGGFDLAAAEKVCGVEPIEDFEVLDLLGSLVDKSLVMLEERESGIALPHAGDDPRLCARKAARQTATRPRPPRCGTASTSSRWPRTPSDGLEGAEQGDMDPTASRPNSTTSARAMALPLAGGVDPFIAVKSGGRDAGLLDPARLHHRRAGRGASAALALPAIQASDLAQGACAVRGRRLAEGQSDHAEARQMLETCLALRRELGDPGEHRGHACRRCRRPGCRRGDAEAPARASSEALEIFRRLGDRVGEAIGLLHLGQIALYEATTGRPSATCWTALDLARDNRASANTKASANCCWAKCASRGGQT